MKPEALIKQAGNGDKMKNIGVLRAYLSDLYRGVFKAKLAVDFGDDEALKKHVKEMKNILEVLEKKLE